ncbi:NIPSNAP family protein [Mucilaginibacter sp.]|uniref:NIPSNAP family protein n=1 Tax=Mucilaginibacter sp. TaxID=1882438 RepID=UPI0025DE4B6F|nr:NIPSNAP family protein [Mucilaginibacter sp.]
MKRRSFLATTIITTSGAMLPSIAMSADSLKKNSSEFYELRTYNLSSERQQKLVEDYFEKAAIPALNRIGVTNIGVFKELKPAGQTKIYALIPYSSIDAFITINQKFETDKAYKDAGAAYLNAPATEPAYDRIESSLLTAFAHMPKMNVPAKKDRLFELRRYEHATESAGKKKLEMFNDAGEIDIFKRLGFNPVFFGETIIGDHRPNLIYMVTFDDMAAHDRNWKAFGGDAEWKKISSIPDYADAKLVSHITSTFLSPLNCSQI